MYLGFSVVVKKALFTKTIPVDELIKRFIKFRPINHAKKEFCL